MSDDFTIAIEKYRHPPERVMIGTDASGNTIGFFYLDQAIKDAVKDPDHFRRRFNATVCDVPDTPADYDLKRPSKLYPEIPYAHPESALFYVEALRTVAKELGLPTECQMSSLPAPAGLPARVQAIVKSDNEKG